MTDEYKEAIKAHSGAKMLVRGLVAGFVEQFQECHYADQYVDVLQVFGERMQKALKELAVAEVPVGEHRPRRSRVRRRRPENETDRLN